MKRMYKKYCYYNILCKNWPLNQQWIGRGRWTERALTICANSGVSSELESNIFYRFPVCRVKRPVLTVLYLGYQPERHMNMIIYTVSDNGGRRTNAERRQQADAGYSPERRSGGDRRSGLDRRRNRYKNCGEMDRRQLADII